MNSPSHMESRTLSYVYFLIAFSKNYVRNYDV
jgi:hypothetical protein